MILRKVIMTDFKGVRGTKEVKLNMFNSIVGRNDAGKSTILKAIDAVLNNKTLERADFNNLSENSQIIIDLWFDFKRKNITLGEEIITTVEDEELTNSEGFVVWRKTWNVTEENVSRPKNLILRKVYQEGYDFIFKTETQLMAQCAASGIRTSKGNGDDYNNVEKRRKIRAYNIQNQIDFNYEFTEIPNSGTSKAKIFGDSIKKSLPSFQYFKADTSLSDTDNVIQKYFKSLAYNLINNEINTDNIEETVTHKLGSVLEKVTNKINDVVDSTEKVEPKIIFDWSKLISTSFVSASAGRNIPLSSRGDGFRRITMMSYFEYLAESERANDSERIIFGFEEPETFLHPSAQENLYEKLISLSENEFQVITSTHSSTIVGNTQKDDIIHITTPGNVYTVNQSNVDYKSLAVDLGIRPDNVFTPLFSTSKLLFLVEGIDDAMAMHYQSETYKNGGLIDRTFNELGVSIIPIGGCGEIKHWINLDLFTKLEKPFFILLDSDKESAEEVSVNYTKLLRYNLTHETEFLITKKRMLENYIHPDALQRLVPGSVITYGDFCHAKKFCKRYPDSGIRARIGGGNVVERHYCSLTLAELRQTWCVGGDDEFINIYNTIVGKLQV